MNADDRTYALFDELGLQGGGYTWEGIAHALVALRAPELAEDLDVNAESEEMFVYSGKLSALQKLESLLREAAANHDLLRGAIERAGDELE